MPISAVYRKGVIKPLVEVDLKENEKIEIEIKRKEEVSSKSVVDEISGKLKLKQEIIDELVGSEDAFSPEGF